MTTETIRTGPVLLRRGALIEAGLGWRVIRQLVASGALRQVHPPGTKYAFYRKEEVLAVVMGIGRGESENRRIGEWASGRNRETVKGGKHE